MKKFDLKKIDSKQVVNIASALVMGVIAVSNALSNQKKEQEFEDMKKTLSELKENK